MSAPPLYTALPAGPQGDLVASVAQPDPSPSAPATFEPTDVSPGLLGFVPVFLIALASLALFLSLTRHLRRVTVRQAAVDAGDAQATHGGAVAGEPGTGGAEDRSRGPRAPEAPGGSGSSAVRPGDEDPRRP